MSSEFYKEHYIKPDWDAPANVKAFSTTRLFGASRDPFAAFNLGLHVGDNGQEVNANRKRLVSELELKSAPFWLEQVHSNKSIAYSSTEIRPEADASFASLKNRSCVVMTADCMPILLANNSGDWVAACHAGWRGLLDGVIENTVANYPSCTSELIAWIGPSITQPFFEVGEDVLQLFSDRVTNAADFFEKNSNEKFQFDFIGLAKSKMNKMGITVFGGDLCTFANDKLFYSYRRDGKTGRTASLIWFE
ncbi:MAG: peptidoglycan editing factor PgeF [Kangiellaceae bacterium]|nr:peptidoglycan editing factor PgeF [Kangiellaceae bacterium]